MRIKFLKVKCGDSIFIHLLDSNKIGRNIIIDTGHHRRKIYAHFYREISELFQRNEKIDLLVLTHRDDDHIGGIWKLMKSNSFDIDSQIENIWLNHSLPLIPNDSKISIGKAVDLKELFQKNDKCPIEPITTLSQPFNFFGISLTILSPDSKKYEREVKSFQREELNRKISKGKNDHSEPIEEIEKRMLNFEEDKSISNGSSIAFLLEYKNKKALLLADSYASIISKSLRKLGYSRENKLDVDFIKVSHHGSRYNTSMELLSLINCQNYIFSTNGKNGHNLPHKETIVRIIKNPERDINKKISILFNQEDDVLTKIFDIDDNPYKKYNFEVIFPKREETLSINF